jgi:hypothetical protein
MMDDTRPGSSPSKNIDFDSHDVYLSALRRVIAVKAAMQLDLQGGAPDE